MRQAMDVMVLMVTVRLIARSLVEVICNFVDNCLLFIVNIFEHLLQPACKGHRVSYILPSAVG